MSKTTALIDELKAFNEDEEFYPTTNEIIQAMHQDLKELDLGAFSILECGAGNGKVLTTLKELCEADENKAYGAKTQPTDFYVIEKSSILLESLPNDFVVVGVDMWANTLIDKKVDLIYSNPPYRDYTDWANKIIREANSSCAYLLIPSRWQGNKVILSAIESRNATFDIVGSFDFLDSEDRKAHV